MERVTTVVNAVTAYRNYRAIQPVLDFIKKYPSEDGRRAKKACNRLIVSTLITIIISFTPLVIFLSLFATVSVKLPAGAVRYVSGYIHTYDDTFWYTENTTMYDFNLYDYTDDTSYESQERIYIYLDDKDRVVSISHLPSEDGFMYNMIFTLVFPFVCIFVNTAIAYATYSKMWSLYAKWYFVEIHPYIEQPDFEEIIATKKFYNVKKKR